MQLRPIVVMVAAVVVVASTTMLDLASFMAIGVVVVGELVARSTGAAIEVVVDAVVVGVVPRQGVAVLIVLIWSRPRS